MGYLTFYHPYGCPLSKWCLYFVEIWKIGRITLVPNTAQQRPQPFNHQHMPTPKLEFPMFIAIPYGWQYDFNTRERKAI